MKKTIFLDFDGVLHGEGIDSQGVFEHLEVFCETVRPFIKNIQIVISSSWRESYKFDDIKGFFEDDIQESVVGATPVRIDGFADGGREKEIVDYCTINSITDWIAIDDMERLFSSDCQNLILCDSQYGLGDGELMILTHFLKH
jgi:HAD domain in Swiss Army Knife RNA repair proteins